MEKQQSKEEQKAVAANPANTPAGFVIDDLNCINRNA